jgi:hypothetical protein
LNVNVWKVGTSRNEAALKRARPGDLPALPATLMRRADDRARLATTLQCAVGDRLLVDLRWRDGSVGFAVDVYAVHARGLVDVKFWQGDSDEHRAAVTLRKS